MAIAADLIGDLMKVPPPDEDDSAMTDRYTQNQTGEDKLQNSMEVLCMKHLSEIKFVPNKYTLKKALHKIKAELRVMNV